MKLIINMYHAGADAWLVIGMTCMHELLPLIKFLSSDEISRSLR